MKWKWEWYPEWVLDFCVGSCLLNYHSLIPKISKTWRKTRLRKSQWDQFQRFLRPFNEKVLLDSYVLKNRDQGCVLVSQFSRSVVSNSLWPHGLQHARQPCPSPTPGVHSNSRPLSQWCHPTISSSVVPFSSCPQSFPASESFPMSQFFSSGSQSTGVLALISVLPMNI